MPQITFLPSGKSIKVRPGTTILNASISARIALTHRCKGLMSCLMCKVKISTPSSILPPLDEEVLKYPAAEAGEYRLACQCKVFQNVTVHIPDAPWKLVVARQLEELRKLDKEDTR